MEETSEILTMSPCENPPGSAIAEMQQMVLAACMGTHRRLGCQSGLWLLDENIIRDKICGPLSVMSLSESYARCTQCEWLVEVKALNVPFPLMAGYTVVDLIKTNDMPETTSYKLNVARKSVEDDGNGKHLTWTLTLCFDDIPVAIGDTDMRIPSSAMRVETNATEMQETFALSDDAVELMTAPLWGIVCGSSGREIQIHGGRWDVYGITVVLEAIPTGMSMSRLPLYVHNLVLVRDMFEEMEDEGAI